MFSCGEPLSSKADMLFNLCGQSDSSELLLTKHSESHIWIHKEAQRYVPLSTIRKLGDHLIIK